MPSYTVELTDEQARALDDGWMVGSDELADLLTQAINRLVLAIRANPPKPPRMDEPGWLGVVLTEGDDGLTTYWVHYHEGWVSEAGDRRDWSDLREPRSVRGGFEQ